MTLIKKLPLNPPPTDEEATQGEREFLENGVRLCGIDLTWSLQHAATRLVNWTTNEVRPSSPMALQEVTRHLSALGFTDAPALEAAA